MMISETEKKVCLVSLGCSKNLVDSEMMLGFLKKDGFALTANPQEAEILIVNTCGFVEDSKQESIDRLFEMARLKETGKCQVLVASGCLTQRYSRELASEMPEVDLFVGTGEFHRIGQFLKERFGLFSSDSSVPLPSFTQHQSRVHVNREQILPDPDLPRVLATPRHYSYLKISEGCSHRCSFCIIPHIRGDIKSRSIGSVVREVEQLVAQGVKEFNLIAQDLNEYGKDLKDGTHLAQLLAELNRISGEFWLRPHYMYPLEFTDRLIRVLQESEHIVKYVDMPLQHINDRIMRSMKRGSPSRYVRQVLDKLKNAMPDLTVRTTFIVGYPGETEEEFQELHDFVKEYEFDRVGVFQYSPEEGTSAEKLPGQLPLEIKQERYHRLMSLQQQISLKKNQMLVGKSFKALSEGPLSEDPDTIQLRLSSQAPEIDGVTYLKNRSVLAGEFVEVKITKAMEYDLVAE